jgi:arsenical-resistance protein 2
MKDYVEEAGGDLQSLVLTGGVKGWVKKYSGRMMDEYDESVWEQ